MPDRHRIEVGDTLAMKKADLQILCDRLRAAGYTLIGPQVKEAAITYAPFISIDELPKGYHTAQAPGHFRLETTERGRLFDFIPGAASWKQYLFPPRLELVKLRKNGKGWETAPCERHSDMYAFIGARPCELAAIQIQDRIFLRDDFTDPVYQERRGKVFTVAVNCAHPGGTCFCTTMGTGPRAQDGFDLCLTELDEHLLVRIGSALGGDMMQDVPFEPASAFMISSAERTLEQAARRATCEINPETCAEDLLGNLDHPHWDDIASRCLSCGNCTLVCPTCFCWDAADITNITQTETKRERIWDSCFNPSYSYQSGGNTRPTIRSRYRQWLTHKFGNWKQQFGTQGCVGCGRCITWCPASIDTRAEVAAFQKEPAR